MATKREKGRRAPAAEPPEGKPGLEAGPGKPENGGPAIDYQPESGQPGPREPTETAERDEDDDL
jgi:hypothetical protein